MAVVASTSERILAQLKLQYPEIKNFVIREEVENVRGGTISIVEFDDHDDEENEVYVWVTQTDCRILDDIPGLTRFINRRTKTDMLDILGTLERILDVGGIAGAIAIVMVGTIAALSIWKQQLVLESLWQPVILSVVAFYFGTKAKKD